MLLFFFLQLAQSKTNLLLNLLRFLQLLFSLHSHILKVVHHFYLLLKSGHLYLNFNCLLF